MKVRKDILLLADQLGAEVDLEYMPGRSDEYRITVDAPEGMIWKATGAECIVERIFTRPGEANKYEVWDSLFTMMQYGFE